MAETTSDLDRLKFDTAKRLAEYYRQEGKKLSAQQIVQRLENFQKSGDASRNRLRDQARKYTRGQSAKYKQVADKSLMKSAVKDAAKRSLSKTVGQTAVKRGKLASKFAFGPIGAAAALASEAVISKPTGINEADVASYIRRHGVWPEDLPAHIDNDTVYAFLGNFTRADALRSMVGAEPLQPLRDRNDAWGRAYRYVTQPREVKADKHPRAEKTDA